MITSIWIYPADSEPIGLTEQGDLVAGDEHGAGTGLDLTAAIVPGSLRFTQG